MIRNFEEKMPNIAESAFISEAAYVLGDVQIGENSSVWPGAVIRADRGGSIRIGNYTHIEDNAVLHSGLTQVKIGNHVIIGHCAVVHARRIENNVLIGANATVLHNVEIGEFSIIAGGTVVIESMIIPKRSFVAGVPGEIKGMVSARQLAWVEKGPLSYAELAVKYREQGL
jgi:carbonic anhydrase/acetyltransferase-like protein (isoleucine patch superfamily)